MTQVIHNVNRAISAVEKLLSQEERDRDWDCYSSKLEVAINILKRELRRREEILAERKAAAAAIDIETCEIFKTRADDLDPYGIGCEFCQGGGKIFVCSADSNGWVWEGDLPEDKRDALYARINRRSAAAEGSA